MFLCQYFLTKGVSDFVFSFFCPCQRSGCCFFFLYFLVVFLFFFINSLKPNPTQLDSTRLDSTANSDSSFYFSFKLDWGPWTTGGSFAFAFRCHRHQPHHEMGSGSAGGVRCGAMQWSRVESNGVEWSAGAVGAATGDRQMGGSLKHFSFGSLADWLGCCLCDGASVFAPQSPHFLPPLPKPNWQWKTTSFIISLFFLSSFFWLFGLVGWLVACLAGWLAENIFCCRFCFSAFLFYFRSLKVNLERSRKWHCRRFQSANWSYLRGSSFAHRLKWNWKWKGAKRGSI